MSKLVTTQYVCDFCGQEIKTASDLFTLSLYKRDLETGGKCGDNPFMGMDMCPECKDKLRKYTKSLLRKPSILTPRDKDDVLPQATIDGIIGDFYKFKTTAPSIAQLAEKYQTTEKLVRKYLDLYMEGKLP